MTTNNWMYDNMVKFLEKNPDNELAVIWFARDEADWVCFIDEDEDAPEKNVAAFQVPLSSFVSFVANVVFKK